MKHCVITIFRASTFEEVDKEAQGYVLSNTNLKIHHNKKYKHPALKYAEYLILESTNYWPIIGIFDIGLLVYQIK